MMLHTNIKALGLVVSEKIFLNLKFIFSLCDIDMKRPSNDQSFMMFISMVKIVEVPLNICNSHRKLKSDNIFMTKKRFAG